MPYFWFSRIFRGSGGLALLNCLFLVNVSCKDAGSNRSDRQFAMHLGRETPPSYSSLRGADKSKVKQIPTLSYFHFPRLLVELYCTLYIPSAKETCNRNNFHSDLFDVTSFYIDL
ncbi:hypothetical protein FRC02_006955 [Tulasnella sp. 418]|nr:hypothetical protein FRC02_006955 [Tulasnella sp. 418]